MASPGERAEYRPMIEWYPEPRDKIFDRIAAHYAPDSLLTKYWYHVSGTAVGFVTALVATLALRRPVLSGIQRYAVYTGVGFGCGYALDRYHTYKASERDAVLRHYMQLHPELFPIPQRKTYGELFEPWTPIR